MRGSSTTPCANRLPIRGSRAVASGQPHLATILNDASALPQCDCITGPAFTGGLICCPGNSQIVDSGDVLNDAVASVPTVDAIGEMGLHGRCCGSIRSGALTTY